MPVCTVECGQPAKEPERRGLGAPGEGRADGEPGKVRAPHPSSDKQTVRGLTGLRCVKSSSCAERRGGNRGVERGLGECLRLPRSLGGARLGSPTSLQPCRIPASQPLRGDPWEADWGADAQVRPHCLLITSAGVGERSASGEPAGRRAAVWLLHSRPWRAAASPASRDPLGKASGQMTVAVRTPRMGAERGPSPLQSWPTVRKGLPVCFLIPLHPRRQVRLLQTQMQPWRRAGPEPGQWASLWRRRPRVPSPNPDPAFWTGC